jgi:hypothetical protein
MGAMSAVDPTPAPALIPAAPIQNRWLLGLAHATIEVSGLPPHDAPATAWLSMLARVCHQVNQEYFRFDLTELGEPDEPVRLPIAPDSGGELAIPAGLDDEHLGRKLVGVTTIGMTGEAVLRLARSAKSCELRDGVVAVYPAFETAVVTCQGPTGGDLLVAHATGPSFV